MADDEVDETAAAFSDKVLDPQFLRLYRSDRNVLCARVGAAGAVHEDLRVRRAFPLQNADHYIGFLLANGDELGLLEDSQALDRESRAVLDEELEKTYFLPVILEFRDIGEEHNMIHATVETSSGPRNIYVRGYRNKIRPLSGDRALVEDVEGNRYLVPDLSALPKLTRDILGF